MSNGTPPTKRVIFRLLSRTSRFSTLPCHKVVMLGSWSRMMDLSQLHISSGEVSALGSAEEGPSRATHTKMTLFEREQKWPYLIQTIQETPSICNSIQTKVEWWSCGSGWCREGSNWGISPNNKAGEVEVRIGKVR